MVTKRHQEIVTLWQILSQTGQVCPRATPSDQVPFSDSESLMARLLHALAGLHGLHGLHRPGSRPPPVTPTRGSRRPGGRRVASLSVGHLMITCHRWRSQPAAHLVLPLLVILDGSRPLLLQDGDVLPLLKRIKLDSLFFNKKEQMYANVGRNIAKTGRKHQESELLLAFLVTIGACTTIIRIVLHPKGHSVAAHDLARPLKPK